VRTGAALGDEDVAVAYCGQRRRLVPVEGWRIETVARRSGVHHSAVRRALRDMPKAERPRRPSDCSGIRITGLCLTGGQLHPATLGCRTRGGLPWSELSAHELPIHASEVSPSK
jgi:hypothetical protein